jgi:acyl carrier protein
MEQKQQQQKAQVFDAVAQLVAKPEFGGIERSQVSEDTHFINDLNFDSLQTVEFVMALEDALHVKVSDEKARELLTVGQVVEYVMQQLDERARGARAPDDGEKLQS